MVPKVTDVTSRGIMLGDVVVARLPLYDPSGHEQEGPRPAVVVGSPELLGEPRFPMVVLAPMTSDRDGAARAATESPRLYPRFTRGTGNLRSDSVCLLDQVRALDASRVESYLGTLSAAEYRPVREGLGGMLDLALSTVVTGENAEETR